MATVSREPARAGTNDEAIDEGSEPTGVVATNFAGLKLFALAAVVKLSRADFMAQCERWYETAQKGKGSRTLMDTEKLAWEGAMEIGLMLLASTFVDHPLQDPKGEYPCPECRKPMRIQAEAQKRTLETALGKFEYARPYCVCDRCGISLAPMDQAMGIPSQGPSALTREMICHAAATTSAFEIASSNLRVLAHIEITAKRVRDIAEREGGLLAEQLRRLLEQYRSGILKGGNQEKTEMMVACCDGGRVQSREGFAEPGENSKEVVEDKPNGDSSHPQSQDSRWKEDKVGVVYDAKRQPNRSVGKREEYEGAKAQTQTYVATMRSWDDFGWMLRTEAELRGYAYAKVKVFLGDGAPAVRGVYEMHFSDAIFVLDWAHANGHLSEFAKAAFGEDIDKAAKWHKQHEDKLWEGKVDEIIAEMQNISCERGLPQKGDSDMCVRVILYRNAFSYFPNNKAAVNYPYFRSLGLPIGSGAVESGVKRFGKRLKGSEKFWNVLDTDAEANSNLTGAEEMLALCALRFSEDGRWEHYWKERAAPRYYLRQ